MKNLKYIWSNFIAPKELETLPEKSPIFDDTIAFSAFALPPKAKIKFVKNMETLEPAVFYSDLQEVELTTEEEAIFQSARERIAKSPPPYNYDNDYMLVSNILYNHDNNTVFVEAKKAKFSLLSCLRGGKFPKDSNIYKQNLYGTSAIMPLITEDGYTVLMERTAFKNWSSPGGALEPIGAQQTLSDSNNLSVVENTAIIEAIEELLGKDENATELSESRIPFIKMPECTHILFRTFKNPTILPYAEFIVPIELRGKKSDLEHVLQTNCAKDKRDHTQNYILVPLSSEKRENALEIVKRNLRGIDLNHIVISAAARLWNRAIFGDQIWSRMDGSRLKVYDVLSICDTIPRTIPPKREEKDISL